MDVMNSVSKNTELKHVPGVYKANNLMRSVGFGMMGLHGFLAKIWFFMEVKKVLN